MSNFHVEDFVSKLEKISNESTEWEIVESSDDWDLIDYKDCIVDIGDRKPIQSEKSKIISNIVAQIITTPIYHFVE